MYDFPTSTSCPLNFYFTHTWKKSVLHFDISGHQTGEKILVLCIYFPSWMICYSGYIMMQILEESASYIFMLSITTIINFSEGNKTHKHGVLQYNSRCLVHLLLLHDTSCPCSQLSDRNSHTYLHNTCILHDETRCNNLSLEHEENICVTAVTLSPRGFIF